MREERENTGMEATGRADGELGKGRTCGLQEVRRLGRKRGQRKSGRGRKGTEIGDGEQVTVVVKGGVRDEKNREGWPERGDEVMATGKFAEGEDCGGGGSTGRVRKTIGMGKIREVRGGAWQRTEEDGGWWGKSGRSRRRGRW